MSEINFQALRDAAEKATQGEWIAFISPGKYGTYAVHTPGDNHHGDIVDWPGFDEQKNAENNARYIAAFNPEVVQALLDEREAQSKRIAELEKSEEQLINERDHAESALADMYFAATGDRPEWSNWFGFSDAVDAVVDRIADLEAKQPSPVVPEEKPMPNPLSMLEREITQLIGDAQEATVTGYELIAEAWRLMDGQDPKTSDWHSKASKYLNSNIVEKVDDDRIEAVKAVLRRLAGNYPVIPDGWVMVPKRLTAENGAKGVLSGEFSETTFISCPECFGDDDCETCDGSGRIEIKVPVSWTTIKTIWAKGCEYFSIAAPQQDG
ncbi:ead/Ea22-like family protein [Escherichia coli]|uniref:ead/Ea22-like family protein n=1 Tax=Escherichia coli TaxID=562 RepID=UPI003A887661